MHEPASLVRGAQMNTTLTSLELNSNNIDYDGATALAEAVKENTSLTALHLRCALCRSSLNSLQDVHLRVFSCCVAAATWGAPLSVLWARSALRMRSDILRMPCHRAQTSPVNAHLAKETGTAGGLWAARALDG